jgi:hypothetical protein
MMNKKLVVVFLLILWFILLTCDNKKKEHYWFNPCLADTQNNLTCDQNIHEPWYWYVTDRVNHPSSDLVRFQNKFHFFDPYYVYYGVDLDKNGTPRPTPKEDSRRHFTIDHANIHASERAQFIPVNDGTYPKEVPFKTEGFCNKPPNADLLPNNAEGFCNKPPNADLLPVEGFCSKPPNAPFLDNAGLCNKPDQFLDNLPDGRHFRKCHGDPKHQLLNSCDPATPYEAYQRKLQRLNDGSFFRFYRGETSDKPFQNFLMDPDDMFRYVPDPMLGN